MSNVHPLLKYLVEGLRKNGQSGGQAFVLFNDILVESHFYEICKAKTSMSCCVLSLKDFL